MAISICKIPSRSQSCGAVGARGRQCQRTIIVAALPSIHSDAGCASTIPGNNVSRRSALLLGVAASLAFLPPVPVHAAAQPVNIAQQGVVEYSRLEEEGKLKTRKELESVRAKYGFKRGPDGRVYLRSSKGSFYAVRLDMEVPGVLLFRSEASGEIFALQTQTLQQVDLSSDIVVMLMFADGEWENDMSPIQAVSEEGEGGKTRNLTMTDSQFRSVIGLISQMDGGEEEKEDQ